jgi:hypothetical protein
MNGPEHYREAEHLLEVGRDFQEALIHALLAQTAATVSAAYGHLSVDQTTAWHLAIHSKGA